MYLAGRTVAMQPRNDIAIVDKDWTLTGAAESWLLCLLESGARGRQRRVVSLTFKVPSKDSLANQGPAAAAIIEDLRQ